MNSTRSQCNPEGVRPSSTHDKECLQTSIGDRDRLDEIIAGSGAYRWGVAMCHEVNPSYIESYSEWLKNGYNAEMAYLEKYTEVRKDPRLLLEGAKSIIVCAFPYYYPFQPREDWPKFSRYSLGTDYHEVVRKRLQASADKIMAAMGGQTRVCVDTAPLRERYWAVQSGLGFVGRNCQLIIPGGGSYFFIGSILTTLEFTPDKPCELSCGSCGMCIKACPTGALGDRIAIPGPILDARRCISYLTIEHRGSIPEGTNMGRRIYGCDTCAEACPHNRHPVITSIEEFRPRRDITELTLETILDLSPEKFSKLFAHSSIKRTKLSGLIRNAAYIADKRQPLSDSKTPE